MRERERVEQAGHVRRVEDGLEPRARGLRRARDLLPRAARAEQSVDRQAVRVAVQQGRARIDLDGVAVDRVARAGDAVRPGMQQRDAHRVAAVDPGLERVGAPEQLVAAHPQRRDDHAGRGDDGRLELARRRAGRRMRPGGSGPSCPACDQPSGRDRRAKALRHRVDAHYPGRDPSAPVPTARRTVCRAARASEGAARRVRPDRPGVHAAWAPGRRRARRAEIVKSSAMQTTHTVEIAPGVQMPLLGLGTWQATGNEAYEAVRAALEIGYRHIDTATMYGNEDQVGRALADSGVARDEVFITTKLPSGRAGAERETLEASLAALGVEQRRPLADPLAAARRRTARRLEPVPRAAGRGSRARRRRQQLRPRSDRRARARHVGAARGEPDRVESRRCTTPRCWQGTVSAASSSRATARSRRCGSVIPRLVRIADSHGVTPAQVVIRWHLEHEIVVIPKSSRRDRIASNADVFGFSLSPDELDELDGF